MKSSNESNSVARVEKLQLNAKQVMYNYKLDKAFTLKKPIASAFVREVESQS